MSSYHTHSLTTRHCAWRDLRKVRIYPRARAITFVMYFRSPDPGRAEYIGRSYVWLMWELSKITVDMEHTGSPSPPTTLTADLDPSDPDPSHAPLFV